ncbi:hypothetical protein CDAR_508711 [Caerostris darwini]|uniref:Uncharacterized protein n=1 Tax=Caerostris darwini TaxID=1538125 RepID=A0AAV4N0D9_9ARAC|nr:hypothetical protein CDAR_508711 [Caerostris darwini]
MSVVELSHFGGSSCRIAFIPVPLESPDMGQTQHHPQPAQTVAICLYHWSHLIWDKPSTDRCHMPVPLESLRDHLIWDKSSIVCNQQP